MQNVTQKVKNQKYHPDKLQRAEEILAGETPLADRTCSTRLCFGDKLPSLPQQKHSIGDGDSAGGSQKEVQDTFGELLSDPLN